MDFYKRHFFKCKSCGFMLTRLAQANKQILGTCPACEEGDFDYAPKADRLRYIYDLLDELEELNKNGFE